MRIFTLIDPWYSFYNEKQSRLGLQDGSVSYYRLFNDLYGFDNRLCGCGDGSVSVRGLCVGADLIYDVHTGRNVSEAGVVAVKMRTVLVHDEELGACAVGKLASRHGDSTSCVLQLVVHAVTRELALDLLIGASGAVALGVAALDHKIRNDAVEGKSVVEAVTCESNEVLYSDGRGVAVKHNCDGAVVLNGDLYGVFSLDTLGKGVLIRGSHSLVNRAAGGEHTAKEHSKCKKHYNKLFHKVPRKMISVHTVSILYHKAWRKSTAEKKDTILAYNHRVEEVYILSPNARIMQIFRA